MRIWSQFWWVVDCFHSHHHMIQSTMEQKQPENSVESLRHPRGDNPPCQQMFLDGEMQLFKRSCSLPLELFHQFEAQSCRLSTLTTYISFCSIKVAPAVVNCGTADNTILYSCGDNIFVQILLKRAIVGSWKRNLKYHTAIIKWIVVFDRNKNENT